MISKNDPLSIAHADLASARSALNAYLFAGNVPLSGRQARNGGKLAKKFGTRRYHNLVAAAENARARIAKLGTAQAPAQAAA
jgi:hypothetical protein